MKNNKRTLYLMVLVITIYAIIGVRFLLFNNESNEELYQQPSAIGFVADAYQEAKVFTIENNYRDPFQITKKASRVEVIKKKNTNSRSKKNNTNKAKDTVQFPQIRYKGLVADTRGSGQIFAIEIDSQEYVIPVGKSMKNVEILEGSSSEITVQYNHVKRIFKLK